MFVLQRMSTKCYIGFNICVFYSGQSVTEITVHCHLETCILVHARKLTILFAELLTNPCTMLNVHSVNVVKSITLR